MIQNIQPILVFNRQPEQPEAASGGRRPASSDQAYTLNEKIVLAHWSSTT